MHGPAPRRKRKWMVVIGTRPEAIKMFPVVHALRALPGVDVRLCASGQHRDLVDPVLAWADLEVDLRLSTVRQGQTLDGLLTRLVQKLSDVFRHDRPDRVIVHGDTLTTFAATLAAYLHKIPVAHVEAGLRSGNMRHPWPEEGVRRMVASVADLHFAPTRQAVDALRAENLPSSALYVTGNTGIDALLLTRAKLNQRPLAKPLAAAAAQFSGKKIITVTAHRRENWGTGMNGVAEALAALGQRPDCGVIFPLHPNPKLRAMMEGVLSGLPHVALIAPLDYPDFVRLLDLSTLILTDSGGIQEEAPSLGKPVLVLRETTERREGVAAGTARLVGTKATRILSEIATLLEDDAAYAAMARAHNPYGDGRAAQRIAEIMARVG